MRRSGKIWGKIWGHLTYLPTEHSPSEDTTPNSGVFRGHGFRRGRKWTIPGVSVRDRLTKITPGMARRTKIAGYAGILHSLIQNVNR